MSSQAQHFGDGLSSAGEDCGAVITESYAVISKKISEFEKKDVTLKIIYKVYKI
jgi:hypothetical protein